MSGDGGGSSSLGKLAYCKPLLRAEGVARLGGLCSGYRTSQPGPPRHPVVFLCQSPTIRPVLAPNFPSSCLSLGAGSTSLCLPLRLTIAGSPVFS